MNIKVTQVPSTYKALFIFTDFARTKLKAVTWMKL